MPPDRGPWSPAQIIEMVCAAVGAIRQESVSARAAGGDAKLVVDLWRVVGRPAPQRLAADVALVASWARLSREEAAQNDIRGIDRRGDRWGADRSRMVRTLLATDRWGDRLSLARAWEARGRKDLADLASSPADHAAAWERVTDAIREHGREARVRAFLNEVQIRALARVGGVYSVSAAPMAQWPSLRATFLRACAERAVQREAA